MVALGLGIACDCLLLVEAYQKYRFASFYLASTL